jgi:hypothetical protein
MYLQNDELTDVLVSKPGYRYITNSVECFISDKIHSEENSDYAKIPLVCDKLILCARDHLCYEKYRYDNRKLCPSICPLVKIV